MNQLFHADNERIFDIVALRAAARHEVESSSLIQRARSGERNAAEALSNGFWPFTFNFEREIDRTLATELARQRRLLFEKFGRETALRQLRSLRPRLNSLDESEETGVFGELREMQKEERTHAAHWAHDALNLFYTRSQIREMEATGKGASIRHIRDRLGKVVILPAVEDLINEARSLDLVNFFARSLTATEFIAEELGDVLAHAEPYTDLFANKRALWMEVHTIPHPDGPSHWQIVLDLARAFSPAHERLEITKTTVERLVLEGTRLFGNAADAVEEYYCPRSERLAAE